jgi:ATP-dependent DNA helicase RecG
MVLLAQIEDKRTRWQLMEALSLKDRKHFTDAYLQPALDAELVEMTILELK